MHVPNFFVIADYFLTYKCIKMYPIIKAHLLFELQKGLLLEYEYFSLSSLIYSIKKYSSLFYAGMGQVQNSHLYLRYGTSSSSAIYPIQKLRKINMTISSLLFFLSSSFFIMQNSKTIVDIWMIYLLNECYHIHRNLCGSLIFVVAFNHKN